LKKDDLIQDALESAAEAFPNSIIADLLSHFPPKIVMEFIEIYSGQYLKIPKVDTVWRSYRNKIIRETLDLKNTSVVRRRLSEYFGIPLGRVSSIYRDEKNKKRKYRKSSMEKSLQRIYAKESKKAFEDMKTILYKKK